jgi:HEAT repeat protein
MPSSCTSIEPFLENIDPLVRSYCARALGKLTCKQQGSALAALLKDGDLRVSVNAARALGDLKDTGAVRPLASMLTEHPSPHARATAAEALGNIDEKDGKDALMQGLLDTSVMVRIQSIRALALILGEKVRCSATRCAATANASCARKRSVLRRRQLRNRRDNSTRSPAPTRTP